MSHPDEPTVTLQEVLVLLSSLKLGRAEDVVLPRDPPVELRAAVWDLLASQARSGTEQELRLRALDRQFRTALAVRDAFLTRMSHELRTPLNAILGYVELLLEGARGDDAVDLARVQAAALNLQAIVTSVLDLTQLQAGSYQIYPESIDIEALVRRVVESIRTSAETNRNTIRVHVDPGIRARLDRRMLESILFNLASNGSKYTSNGTVGIEVRSTRGRLVLAVTDTGIGMTPRQIDEAFRPFSVGDETTTRRYDGTGLGLAVVRGFAEAMAGAVEIVSTAGKGAAVTVDLPLEVEARVPGPSAQEDPDEPTQFLR